jgi:multidrug resistance protein
MQNKSALYVLGFIMFINALAYGAIVPLLYPYAQRFGLNPLGLSLLFTGFSIAQFISTPILGRLSDRYGRKPVLLICLLGTSISLAVFAAAQSVALIFIARIVDGITGGNNSVAQAIVADSVEAKDRAKAFGILGASFGFGFLIGPALGGIMGQFGLSAPFWFASALAMIGTVLGAVILKETLTPANRNRVNHEPLINFSAIFKALVSPTTGLVMGISFISAISLNSFIFSFQTFSNDVLKLTTTQVGLLLGMFGLVSILMQMVGLKILLQKIPSKKRIITASFVASSVVMIVTAFSQSPLVYTICLLAFAFMSAPQNPVITGLLSERTRPEDQGGLLGINQSYVSLGQIIGPVAAGFVASTISIPMGFLLAGGLYALGALVSFGLYRKVTVKANI